MGDGGKPHKDPPSAGSKRAALKQAVRETRLVERLQEIAIGERRPRLSPHAEDAIVRMIEEEIERPLPISLQGGGADPAPREVLAPEGRRVAEMRRRLTRALSLSARRTKGPAALPVRQPELPSDVLAASRRILARVEPELDPGQREAIARALTRRLAEYSRRRAAGVGRQARSRVARPRVGRSETPRTRGLRKK